MSIQSQFKKFNEKIKLDYNTNADLANKRDILVKILKNNEALPAFKTLDQGSYALFTGVEPQDGDEYDIDVGLRFIVNKDDYEPMELKKKICDLLKTHTEYGSKIKKPCVTVTYKKDGEAAYHVDLVTYVFDDCDDAESQLYIAKGIESNKSSIMWEKADPKGLVDFINDSIENKDQRKQFRRLVRYLKKWKNMKFLSSGHNEPPSIGITLLVLSGFVYYEEDDLKALWNVVNYIYNQFYMKSMSENGKSLYRISFPLPISLNFEDDTDIFEKMSDSQMTNFKDKIEILKDNLKEVEDEVEESEQYKKLRNIFGEDFEIPEEKKSASIQRNYIPSSSSSGWIRINGNKTN